MIKKAHIFFWTVGISYVVKDGKIYVALTHPNICINMLIACILLTPSLSLSLSLSVCLSLISLSLSLSSPTSDDHPS